MEEIISWVKALLDVERIIVWGGHVGLIAIVFAETGLLAGFFLPGDSLLVTAGVFAAAGKLDVWTLLITLTIAAIVGDAVGYSIGRQAGRALYSREDSFFFRRKHLMRAREFYEKHGGKTIVIARFVPIIRTFAPTVAGAAEMPYRRFAMFNIVGGAAWVWSMVGGGYVLGKSIPNIGDHIHIVIVVVVFLSILPAVFEWWRERRKNRDGAV